LQIFYYTSLKFHLKFVTMRKILFDTLENFTLSITQRPFFHTPQTFNESKNSLAHTFTFKFDIFKSLKNKFFFPTWKTYNTLKKSFFHTSHSLRNGFLLSLQPCKLKTFPQKDSPLLCLSQPHFGQSGKIQTPTPKSGDLESSETPKNSEDDLRGQISLPFYVFYINEKLLKRRCPKCPRIAHLDICSPSYGQKKGQESNW